ncbi:hypothetical protein [Flavobacterium sp. W22_SRS_FP1]|uniref:hypothetical protein n=1 Tax=Flavobacterium sp. W22_SRS_FP1 TaxID=3240276 RepID=UPI003F8F1394
MNFRLILLITSIFFISCTADENAQEHDADALTNSYNELLLSQVKSTTCTDAQEWGFIAIGSKACGGPAGYIAYSLKINVPEFLIKVENYTKAQKAYNKKWNIISTCDMVMPPSRVECVEGKAKLIYN